MKLKQFIILVFFFPSVCFAQTFYKPGFFVIKGRVKNFKDQLFDFSTSTYLTSVTNSVMVKPNGTFEQQFAVQHLQEIFLHLSDNPMSFTVQDKDTLELEWDAADFKNTFSVKGKNLLRTKELQVQLNLAYSTWMPFIELSSMLNEQTKELTPEKKFTLINQLYNKGVGSVTGTGDFFSEILQNQVSGLYFRFTGLLESQHLLPEFKLKLIGDSANHNYYSLIPENMMISNNDSAAVRYIDIASTASHYSTLNENWFWNVPAYRDFIYDYARFYRPFHSWWSPVPGNITAFNPTLDEYYSALSNLNITVIRDWFITRSIMQGFSSYSFADVEKVYKQAVTNIEAPYLKDTLQKYYTAIRRLKPGNTAPGFSLKNENGQMVSLSDFIGKVVYIDFWGVGCGPCINDIKNYVPKLHAHYRDKNVVFVNICVDSNEKEWKLALDKYKLNGINLIAEGWENNPACKAYYITAIPHYILIDSNGKMVNNNAPGAFEFNLDSGGNAIDRLLK